MVPPAAMAVLEVEEVVGRHTPYPPQARQELPLQRKPWLPHVAAGLAARPVASALGFPEDQVPAQLRE